MILQYPDGDGGLKYLDFGGGSYVLPTASESIKGGVKVGYGLAMNDDSINVTLSGGSSEQMQSFGQIVTVPNTASTLPEDLTQLTDWQVINATSSVIIRNNQHKRGRLRIANSCRGNSLAKFGRYATNCSRRMRNIKNFGRHKFYSRQRS